ncbi:MAG: radical SAM family heme chaperone HemW [Candidatus Cryptobacteroides sp.]|nr:radical SAM family heme chaperone HemW [Candidatus Cryptobacteroides sp.]
MIYIHIPFCRSFCTYCGFYSEVAGEESYGTYADAICAEAAARSAEIRDTAETNTLYIGGGTPSVLPLSVLERIVGAVSPFGPFREFTIEVNPEDIVKKGPEYVSGLLSLGVNRVSMGIQSFDDRVLRWMNRRHNSERALEAVRILREAGVGNMSIDLIFGIADFQESWLPTVRQALDLHPEHISAYQLSVEEGSSLEALIRRGRVKEAPEELCRSQYDLLCRELSAAGYRHYEVSNFAVPGHEAVHNSAYWRRVPYVGLGAGAHSLRGTDVRSWNSATLPVYEPSSEKLSEEDIRVEKIMLGLRTDVGVPEEFLAAVSAQGSLGRLLGEGALVRIGDMVRIPEDRMFVSDEIIRELL